MRSHLLARSASIAVALFLLAHAARAQRFEGVITAKILDQDAVVTYSIKGAKLRTEMSMGPEMRAASIIDRAAGKTYLLLPMQQAYIERDLDTSRADERSRAESEAGFAWTGTHQTIAGVPCDDAVITDGTQLNMCIARGIMFVAGTGTGARGAPQSSWQSRIQGGFPMRVQRAGEPTPLMEVTSVERKSLPDELFAPPPSWRKMSMPMGHP